MVVTVVIKAGDKFVSSRAIYEYTGGHLSDQKSVPGDDTYYEGTEDLPMHIEKFGMWRFVRHEYIDIKN